MAGSDPSLTFLLESRGAAALLYGGSMALLLWLLTLVRLRGALAAGGLVAVAFVGRGWDAAQLLAALLTACSLVGRVPGASRSPSRGGRPGARDVLSIGLAGTLALPVSALASRSGAWLDAATGALATGTAAWVLLTAARTATEPVTRLSWFPDPHGRAGGIAVRAPVMAALAATLVAAGALGAGLLRPGAPAPVALGAFLALGILALSPGAMTRIGASVIGGALAWLLAAFLA